MAQTSLKQKLFLFLFAIICTGLVLEVGLRAGAWLFLTMQEQRNHVNTAGQEYRILCLGESTTALGGEESYPRQLEQILNARQNQIKFKVINKGVPATTTDQIVARSEKYLVDYQPQLVVAMMGINDPVSLSVVSWRDKWSQNSKVFKLFDMLVRHWTARQLQVKDTSVDRQIQKFAQQVAKDPSSRVTFELVKANLYRSANRPEEEKQAIEQALKLDPRNSQAWYLLGIHFERQADYQQALESYQKANTQISQEFKMNIIGHMAHCYKLLNQNQEALQLYLDILKKQPNHPEANDVVGDIYQEEKNYPQAIKYFEQQLSANPHKAETYGKLAHCYRLAGYPSKANKIFVEGIRLNPNDPEVFYEWGYTLLEDRQYRLALEVFKKAIALNKEDRHGVNEKINARLLECYEALNMQKETSRLKDDIQDREIHFNTLTQKSYYTLAEQLKNRGIPLVAVQYPRRTVAPLQSMLFAIQGPGIIIVDNQQVFEEAILKNSYDAYFSDRFAGDFGHCTAKGNTILAEHVADKILKEVLKTK